MKRKAPKCPICKSERVAEIFYGMPAFDEIEDDLRSGRIVLGGCVIEEENPKYRCLDCEHEFGILKFPSGE